MPTRTTHIRTTAGVAIAASALAGCASMSTGPNAGIPQAPEPAPVAAVPANERPETPAARNQAPASGMVGTTTNIRRVTFAEEGADFDPTVSRDGSKLVFASTQHRPTSDIYIKRTDSRVVTQLTTDPADDAMPAISPDGSKIAFSSNRGGNWDVYVMPITGGKAVQISSDSADEVQPSWSPDGRQLVFARQGVSSGRWELWVTAIENPATANFIGFGMHPRWCPVAGTGEGGSDRILYQLGRERGRRSFSIWTLDYANGNATNTTEIAGSADAALMNPGWSPDGHWVAFAETSADDSPADRSVSANPARSSTLWMVSVEGEGKVRLTTDTAASFSPVWAASNRLFFTSNMGGPQNIWSLDVSQAVAAAMATMPVSHSATAQITTPGADHETSNTIATVPSTGGEQEPR